jgi:hypothetical protein
VLSDHEQRALDDIERSFAIEAPRLFRAGRAVRRWNGPPGFRTVSVLGIASVALVFASVPAAGLALATATGIAWLYWRVWSHRLELESFLSPPADEGDRRGGAFQHYLGWLIQPPLGR